MSINFEEMDQRAIEGASSWDNLFESLEQVARKKRGNHKRRLLKELKDAKDAFRKYEVLKQIKIMQERDVSPPKVAAELAKIEGKLLRALGEQFGYRLEMDLSDRKQKLTQLVNDLRSDDDARLFHEMHQESADFTRNNLELSDQDLGDGIMRLHEKFVSDYEERNGKPFDGKDELLDPDQMKRLVAAIREGIANEQADTYQSINRIRSVASTMEDGATAGALELLQKYAPQIEACEADYDEEIAMNFMFDLAQLSAKHDIEVPSPEEMEETLRMFFDVLKDDDKSAEGFNDLLTAIFK